MGGFFLEWGEGVFKMQTEISKVYFFKNKFSSIFFSFTILRNLMKHFEFMFY